MNKSKLNQRKHWGEFTNDSAVKQELAKSEFIDPQQKLERLRQLQNINLDKKVKKLVVP